jgi:hypothetical protein
MPATFQAAVDKTSDKDRQKQQLGAFCIFVHFASHAPALPRPYLLYCCQYIWVQVLPRGNVSVHHLLYKLQRLRRVALAHAPLHQQGVHVTNGNIWHGAL